MKHRIKLYTGDTFKLTTNFYISNSEKEPITIDLNIVKLLINITINSYFNELKKRTGSPVPHYKQQGQK